MIQFKHFEQASVHYEEIKTTELEHGRFYHTPFGTFPSMTTILGAVGDDSGLKKWRERVGDEEADRQMKTAGARGNSLHLLCEKYLNNDLKQEDLQGDGKILFNRAKRHLDEIQLVLGTEIPLYNPELRYAGRTDGVVVLHDLLTILDHKNANRPINLSYPSGKQKFHKYQLQCVGYALAFEKMYGELPTQGCLVVSNQLQSSSTMHVFRIADFIEEFKSVVDLYYSNFCF